MIDRFGPRTSSSPAFSMGLEDSPPSSESTKARVPPDLNESASPLLTNPLREIINPSQSSSLLVTAWEYPTFS